MMYAFRAHSTPRPAWKEGLASRQFVLGHEACRRFVLASKREPFFD
jgi:hypothetical protein